MLCFVNQGALMTVRHWHSSQHSRVVILLLFVLEQYRWTRFGKSTHISMIGNSVTHLRSNTNSAIAGNSAAIPPVTPRNRRRRRIERRRLHIERWHLHIERWHLRIKWRCWMMFHNVLNVSWCFTSGSRCFTYVSWCFTMFKNVLWCLASRATIGIADRWDWQCRRDRR